ncbi:hypothetical protein L3Q82_021973 [Scortum barcoo]|uniref:Uncharacterized protein n=1 Tax=Scortum barcoo TaxID=214431 RepID=A0ACB8X4K2_9TELE|nr:hypothetical protein L3Q82_021973 [Scortum barcoo]
MTYTCASLCLCTLLCLPHSTYKFVREGENLELTAVTKEQSGSYECIASNDISSPDVRTVTVTVQLLFNGLNGVKIENQGKQSMLVFFNVSEEDYGNYTCVAMNIMGITNASIILYGKKTHKC